MKITGIFKSSIVMVTHSDSGLSLLNAGSVIDSLHTSNIVSQPISASPPVCLTADTLLVLSTNNHILLVLPKYVPY